MYEATRQQRRTENMSNIEKTGRENVESCYTSSTKVGRDRHTPTGTSLAASTALLGVLTCVEEEIIGGKLSLPPSRAMCGTDGLSRVPFVGELMVPGVHNVERLFWAGAKS